MKAVVLVFFIILFQWSALALEGGTKAFSSLIEEYFDYYFKTYPTFATAAGIHQYDTMLEDYSKSAIQRQISAFKKFAFKLKAIDLRKLSFSEAIDYAVLTSHVQARLLDFETIQMWEKNPDQYNSLVSQSIYLLISRNFSPLHERLYSVIEREKKIPELFQAARENLKNPPRLYTEIALEQVRGTIEFFQKDVPLVFKDVQDESLQIEFRRTNQKTILELEKYQTFLKERILPESNGGFQLGKSLYRKKLLYEEMVNTPLDELLKIGFKNLRENQKWFKETAFKIDAKRSSSQILMDMTKDHPSTHQLLDNVRDVIGGIRAFIINRKIVTLPSPVLPIIQETPSFSRALFFASMEAPGPYETKAIEAYYHVTPPETFWEDQQIEEHLQEFNRPVILSTSIHETYPGHYTQFLWFQKVKSKVRKLLGCSSNIEGWAHYTEQMMLDEGYGNQDPYLRLGQLQDALLRNARFIVGIQMHTSQGIGRMNYEEAIDFFEKEGYQSRTNARREARRGAIDPTYLYYTLGKLDILKLRDDYKKIKGEKFSLLEFHDEFLKQGPIPLKLVRKALLKEKI